MNNMFSSKVLATFLAGCAVTAAFAQPVSNAVSTDGQSKLVISRNTDLQYMVLNARLDVNGVRVAQLKRGESYVAVLKPGVVNLGADGWGWSGNYKASFNLEADREYFFELGPREGSLAVVVAFGGLGADISAAVGENTGPFSMKLKDIKPLRQTPPSNQANTATVSNPTPLSAVPMPPAVAAPVSSVQPNAPLSDEITQLQKLKDLRDRNLITAEEYETKRKVIVDKL